MAAASVQAQEPGVLAEPFRTGNRNPLVQAQGLPAALGARLLPVGVSELALQAEVGNSFSLSRNGEEDIALDGESWRVALAWRTGLGQRWELGLEVPWISHDGGDLDGLIEDWHSWWNLPDGNREALPRDRLQYRYRRQGETLLDLASSEEGLGDVRAQLAYQLTAGDGEWLALRAHTSLATGDAGRLTGSGGNTLGASLHYGRQGLLGNPRWHLQGSLGGLWMADPDLLATRVNDVVGFGSLTLAWSASPRLSVKLQLDGHTPLYDSALTELGDPAWQLVLGGSLQLAPSLVLDAWLSEDIAVDTSPDVVFGLGMRFLP